MKWAIKEDKIASVKSFYSIDWLIDWLFELLLKPVLKNIICNVLISIISEKSNRSISKMLSCFTLDNFTPDSLTIKMQWAKNSVQSEDRAKNNSETEDYLKSKKINQIFNIN